MAWAGRFPAIADAAGKLRARTFTLDGEAVVCGADGIAVFDGQRRLREAFLCAFDPIKLDDEDLRHWPCSKRTVRLERLLAGRNGGIVLNQHVVEKGAVVFAAACRIGLEGIASKRLDAPYRSGRSRDWIKTKNPVSPTMLIGAGRCPQVARK